MIQPITKKCVVCCTVKSRDEFYKINGKDYNSKWDCRSSTCKSCQSRLRTEERRELKRQAVAYKGHLCIDCGLKDAHPSVYDFHHLDSDKKDFNLGAAKTTKFDDRIKTELDKCVLLCANCHRIRHYSNDAFKE